MKTYRRHNCTRTHRTWTTLAKCIWPRAIWIHGNGPYASVARCGRGTTVQLCPTPEDAQEMKTVIDGTGCGGMCRRQHEVIELARPAITTPRPAGPVTTPPARRGPGPVDARTPDPRVTTHNLEETPMTDLNDHAPEQFYFDAETEHCPHKPIPARGTDAWDEWMTLGHQPYDNGMESGVLCLSAPAELGCPACSEEQGDMVAWSRCETRSHARPVPKATVPQHRSVTVDVAGLECLERECEEFFTDDGDEIPGKETCSHFRRMAICEACSEPPAGDADPFPAVVAWADCQHQPAAPTPRHEIWSARCEDGCCP